MSEESYKKILKELGQSVGLPDLKADSDNHCCLSFDDKIITHIQYNDDNKVVILFTQLGSIDPEKQASLYPRLLKANLFWQGTGGATLSVDDDNNEAILANQLPIATLDSSKFQEYLENFINTAELWINTIEVIQKEEKLINNQEIIAKSINKAVNI